MNGSARAPADLHPVAGGTAELPMLQGLAEVLAGMLPTGSKLVLHWREHCPDGCIAGDHKGFGSMLIDSSARQLDGTIVRDFTPQGCVVEITFPLTATEPPA